MRCKVPREWLEETETVELIPRMLRESPNGAVLTQHEFCSSGRVLKFL